MKGGNPLQKGICGVFLPSAFLYWVQFIAIALNVLPTAKKAIKTNFKALQLFCGLGGGAKGFQLSQIDWGAHVAQIENLCGIDADPEACIDFENLTGVPAHQLDLFSREQYKDFHGHEPPEGWEEVSPYDIWRATNGIAPDIVFTSPPCKGFSALLPNQSANTKKYQALNQLTVRGVKLCLDAFSDDLPSLFLLENVPRITTRGKRLLIQIKNLLMSYGYAVSDGFHDCGEIGGLGQHRKRYLLIARHQEKMPAFLYQPPIRDVKSIGNVLEALPLPDDPRGGRMHRLPRLNWKTLVRLALIPSGGDWRDLEKFDHTQYRIQYAPRNGALGVADWDKPAWTVTGAAGFGRSTGVNAVADPRGTPNRHRSHYRIEKWDETAHTVTGASHVANGRICVSDPRLRKREGRHPGVYQIVPWDKTSPCITGTRFGSGALANSDPRLNCNPRSGTYGVADWDQPISTVIGSCDVHAGTAAVGDPRIPDDNDRIDPPPVIIALDGCWHRPLTTWELYVLQGFDPYFADGRPVELAGKSDARHRERVGNAVPPLAAKAIGETMLRSLMAAQEGTWFLSADPFWVSPHTNNNEYQVVH